MLAYIFSTEAVTEIKANVYFLDCISLTYPYNTICLFS